MQRQLQLRCQRFLCFGLFFFCIFLLVVSLVVAVFQPGCCLRRPHMTASLTWMLNNCCCIPEFRCESQTTDHGPGTRDTCIFITFSNCDLNSDCWSHECPHKCCLLVAGQQFNYPQNMQMPTMRALKCLPKAIIPISGATKGARE